MVINKLASFISKFDCNSKTCSVRIFGMLHKSLKGIKNKIK